MARSRCLHGTFTASPSPRLLLLLFLPLLLLLLLLSLCFRLYAFTAEYYTGAGDLRGASTAVKTLRKFVKGQRSCHIKFTATASLLSFLPLCHLSVFHTMYPSHEPTSPFLI